MEKISWKTEKRKVSELVPWEQNPRRLTEKQGADLRKSLEKFDLMSIPVVNTNGKLISGHQRVEILKLLGRNDEEIDVRVPNRQLTEEEHTEAALRENQNQGSWDYEMLANNYELPKLLEIGFTESQLDIIDKPIKKVCDKCFKKVVRLDKVCICSMKL